MNRGVVYITWGSKCKDVLDRSIASVQRVHPDLAIYVAHREDGNLHDKAAMYEISPYEETLFLDADTIVCSRLDYGFDQCRKHNLALSICECPWASRYPSVVGDVVEYNTGVVFFRKCNENAALFSRWSKLTTEMDSSIQFTASDGQRTMTHNDQCAFAMAVDELNVNPFVLPQNWNLRPLWHKRWFGSIRVWHDYAEPPPNIGNRKPMELFSID